MALRLVEMLAPLAAGVYAERELLTASKTPGSGVPEALVGSFDVRLPRAFGLVVLVNFIGSGFALTYLGGKVIAAREKYGVKLPTMYAPGTTPDEVKFNSVQRGHQQALETYPQFLALSLVAGLAFPLTTAVEGALWCVARFAWAEGYATGDPDNRYKFSWLGKHVWTPLVHMLILSLFVGGKVLATGRL